MGFDRVSSAMRWFIGVLLWTWWMSTSGIAQTLPPLLEPVRPLIVEGRWEAAYQRTVELVEQFPNCYECYHVLVWLADTLHRTEEIVPILRRGVTTFPDDQPLRKILARLYLDQHRYDSAIELLQPLGERLDTQGRELLAAAYAQWALQAYQRQYFDRALQRIQQALRWQPADLDYLTFLFALAWQQRRCDLIEQKISLLYRLKPAKADFYLVAAQCAVRANRLPEAEKVLMVGKKVVGHHREIERLLAQVLLFRSKWDQAFANLRDLLRRYPDDREIWEQLVDAWIYVARYDSARALLQRMVHRFPDQATNFWRRIGQLYERQEAWQAARQLYRSGVQQQLLSDSAALHLIARTFVEEQRADSLRMLLHKARNRQDSALLLWFSGMVYDQLQQQDSAARYYWRSLQQFPDSARAERLLTFLVFFHRDTSRIWRSIVPASDRAQVLFQFLQWRWQSATDTASLVLLRQFIEQMGQMQQQVKHQSMAVATETPIDWDTRYVAALERAGNEVFASVLRQLRPQRLRRFLEEMIAQYPEVVYPSLWLARWLMQQQRWEEALAVLDRATQQSLRHPELHQMRAEIAVQQRRYRTALLEILRALQQAPEDSALYQRAIQLSLQGDFARQLAQKWEIQYQGAMEENPVLRQALIQLYEALGEEEKARALRQHP